MTGSSTTSYPLLFEDFPPLHIQRATQILSKATVSNLKSGKFLAETLDLPKSGFGEMLPSEVINTITMYF